MYELKLRETISNAGAFSVKLTVNGRSLTQPLTVKPDPRER